MAPKVAHFKAEDFGHLVDWDASPDAQLQLVGVHSITEQSRISRHGRQGSSLERGHKICRLLAAACPTDSTDKVLYFSIDTLAVSVQQES